MKGGESIFVEKTEKSLSERGQLLPPLDFAGEEGSRERQWTVVRLVGGVSIDVGWLSRSITFTAR